MQTEISFQSGRKLLRIINFPLVKDPQSLNKKKIYKKLQRKSRNVALISTGLDIWPEHWGESETDQSFVLFVKDVKLDVLVVTRLLQKPDLVDEVEGNSSLASDHLFSLEIFQVLFTDCVHASLQFPSNLVFLPVLLALYWYWWQEEGNDESSKTETIKTKNTNKPATRARTILNCNSTAVKGQLLRVFFLQELSEYMICCKSYSCNFNHIFKNTAWKFHKNISYKPGL